MEKNVDNLDNRIDFIWKGLKGICHQENCSTCDALYSLYIYETLNFIQLVPEFLNYPTSRFALNVIQRIL